MASTILRKESIIKKHAGKKKKRSPCHLLTQQNCKGEQSEWQWWRALEIGYSARQLRVFSGSALDRIAVVLSLIFSVSVLRKAATFIHQVCPKKMVFTTMDYWSRICKCVLDKMMVTFERIGALTWVSVSPMTFHTRKSKLIYTISCKCVQISGKFTLTQCTSLDVLAC